MTQLHNPSLLKTQSVVMAIDLHVANRKPLIVIPNMGNAGDALINHAIYSTLKNKGIPFLVQEAATLSDVSDVHTYLIMANGSLHGNKHPMDEVIAKINAANGDMVIFSATIAERDSLLRGLHGGTVIVCREPVSYGYVCRLRPDLTVALSEDATMAIADGDASLPEPLVLKKILMKSRTLIKAIKLGYPAVFGLAPLSFRSIRPKGLYAYRCDSERPNLLIPERNIDLSLVVSVRRQTPPWAEACAGLFLQIIKSKKVVHTNRLHVAIGCCLTKTPCHFSPNNYFKCEAIFEHSLKGRFANITWIREADEGRV